jgi:hypothetical protein
MTEHSNVESLKSAYDAIGGAVETALRNQTLASDAIKRMSNVCDVLEAQADTLPKGVIAAVKRDVKSAIGTPTEDYVDSLDKAKVKIEEASTALEKASAQATTALQEAAKHAIFRVSLPALIISFIAMAMWYGFVAFSVHQLKDEKVELTKEVEALKAESHNWVIRNCGRADGSNETCIQGEPAPGYGGYFIPTPSQ